MVCDTFSAALDEETVSHLHDVSLVHSRHLVSAIVMSILEGVLSHTGTGNPGDDLQYQQHFGSVMQEAVQTKKKLALACAVIQDCHERGSIPSVTLQLQEQPHAPDHCTRPLCSL